MPKVLVSEKIEVAQDLLAEALASRRKLKPGILIRYAFHAFTGKPPEATYMHGIDRVEMLRNKEPRVFLERLQDWIFSRDCLLLPRDSRYSAQEAKHEAALKASRKT